MRSQHFYSAGAGQRPETPGCEAEDFSTLGPGDSMGGLFSLPPAPQGPCVGTRGIVNLRRSSGAPRTRVLSSQPALSRGHWLHKHPAEWPSGGGGTHGPLQPWHIQRDMEERERPRRTGSHVLLADVFKKPPGRVGRGERGEPAGLLLAVPAAGAQAPTARVRSSLAARRPVPSTCVCEQAGDTRVTKVDGGNPRPSQMLGACPCPCLPCPPHFSGSRCPQAPCPSFPQKKPF